MKTIQAAVKEVKEEKKKVFKKFLPKYKNWREAIYKNIAKIENGN